METKLKSRFLTSLLYHGAKITNSQQWDFLNEFIRNFYLKVFIPCFESYLLRPRGSKDLKLIPRHSVAESNEFNLFLSDLDFSLVFKQEPEEKRRTQVIKDYFRISKIFPFVGELEIYTETEWLLRNQLTSKHQKLFTVLWNLRKWSWQKEALLTASSNYHKYKALRSITRCQKKLEHCLTRSSPNGLSRIPISDCLNHLLPDLVSQSCIDQHAHFPGVSGKSGYLGWEFSGLNPLFAAFLPDAEWSFPEFLEFQNLRYIQEVGENLGALCAFDLLLLKSRKRAYNLVPLVGWYEHLEKLIATYTPPLIPDSRRT